MNNAIIYVGKYSPTLMGIQDIALKNNFNDLIFIETSLSKSKISKGLCKEQYSLQDPVEINNKILELAHFYDHIYCLSLSYNDTLNLHDIEPNSDKVTVLGANKECIEILLNKEKMNHAAMSAGLPLLQNLDIHDDNISSHFPLVLRPKNENNATFKAAHINNNCSLQPYLKLDVVAQPFILGPNIVVHFSKLGKQFNVECFIVNHKYEGVTLTLEKHPMITANLLTNIQSFLESIEFIGIGHIEFIKDEKNGELYFLDFNGRFGGTSLKAAALGFNEFYLICSHYMPSSFKKNITSNALLVSNTLALTKCIKTVSFNRKNILDYPQKDRSGYFFQLIKLFFVSKDELRFPTKRIIKDYFYNLIKRKLNK